MAGAETTLGVPSLVRVRCYRCMKGRCTRPLPVDLWNVAVMDVRFCLEFRKEEVPRRCRMCLTRF